MALKFPSPTSKWHQTTYDSISPTRPELSAKGKTVLITGGGTGIGAETASYFAQAGASRIAILGRREQPLLDTKASFQQKFPHVEIFTASTDVTNKSQVDAAFSKFLENGKKIDVLVSNAAVAGPADPIAEVDSDKFVNTIDTNVKGSLLVAQAFLRHAATDAVAIDVNSAACHLSFSNGFSSYSVAKLAVFRLWDSLAYAHPEVTVFHTQPGVIDTAMSREAGGTKALGYEDDGKLERHKFLESERFTES